MRTQYDHLIRTLANNIRTFRREAGYSQEQFALEADVDRTFVSQIERMVANPSLRTIARLADVLGISVNTLLQESTPRQNSR